MPLKIMSAAASDKPKHLAPRPNAASSTSPNSYDDSGKIRASTLVSRKHIVRLLIDDVTLIKSRMITAYVRLSGNAPSTLVLERPLPIAQIRRFKPELVAIGDQLLDQYCDREIADILSRDGWRKWEGKPFNLKKVAWVRAAYKLSIWYDRLRRRGMLTTIEVATTFGISKNMPCMSGGVRGLLRSATTTI